MRFDPEDNLRFDFSAIKDEVEHRNAQLLLFHLANLAELVRQFGYAVDLLEHSAKQRHYSLPDTPATHWANMAGMHAALTIYHFRASLNAVVERLGQCRSLIQNVDTKALEAVRERFREQFPYAKHIRDAVGHSADRMFKPENVDEHGFGDRKVIVSGQIFKGDFIISHKNHVLQLPMDPQTREILRDLKLRVYSAFEKLLQPPPQVQTSPQ